MVVSTRCGILIGGEGGCGVGVVALRGLVRVLYAEYGVVCCWLGGLRVVDGWGKGGRVGICGRWF